jgi:hypothetical protein
MKYDWDNPKKVNNSNNPILNKLGNLCHWVAKPINALYYRWGTFYEFQELDLTEDIDRELEKQ